MSHQLPSELRKRLPQEKIKPVRFRKKIMALSFNEMLLIYSVMRRAAHIRKADSYRFMLELETKHRLIDHFGSDDPHLQRLEAGISKEERFKSWCEEWIAALSPDVGSTIELQEFIARKGLTN